MLVGHLHIFGKMSSPLLSFKLVCLSVVELEVFFIYPASYSHLQIHDLKAFSPFCEGFFPFLIVSFLDRSPLHMKSNLPIFP